MIVIDTSAVVAIAFGEAERETSQTASRKLGTAADDGLH